MTIVAQQPACQLKELTAEGQDDPRLVICSHSRQHSYTTHGLIANKAQQPGFHQQR